MARIRSIKPEFWTSDQLSDCTPTARLLFIGLWTFSDDNGIHKAKAKRLRMEVFPADPFTPEEMDNLIDELIHARLLREYEHEGEFYWQVTGWKDHQRIDQPTYRYPKPDGTTPENPNRRRPRSANTSKCSANTSEHSQVFDVGVERSGVERIGKKSNSPTGGAEYPDWFDGDDGLWQVYPKRHGGNPKKDAYHCCNARLKEGHTQEQLRAGTIKYAFLMKTEGKIGTPLVMTAKRFYGTNKEFLDDWKVMSKEVANKMGNGLSGALKKTRDENLEVFANLNKFPMSNSHYHHTYFDYRQFLQRCVVEQERGNPIPDY